MMSNKTFLLILLAIYGVNMIFSIATHNWNAFLGWLCATFVLHTIYKQEEE